MRDRGKPLALLGYEPHSPGPRRGLNLGHFAAIGAALAVAADLMLGGAFATWLNVAAVALATVGVCGGFPGCGLAFIALVVNCCRCRCRCRRSCSSDEPHARLPARSEISRDPVIIA